MGRTWQVVAAVAAAVILGGQTAGAQTVSGPVPGVCGVRALNPDVAVALANGLERSATLRDLVHDVEALGGVVIVESVSRGLLMQRGVWGATSHDLIVAGPFRIVHVAIVTGRGDMTIETIAHELQHVREILESGAADRQSVDRLYERIGYRVRAGVYETDNAAGAGWNVAKELSASSGRR